MSVQNYISALVEILNDSGILLLETRHVLTTMDRSKNEANPLKAHVMICLKGND